ncbi:MAG TPA: hypothetical protein DEP48_07085 [Persephonella sp.]|uniref:Uncharacterized protein n=1 Tax=Persephonella marina (strain DSM 14350 / EX-H1) TaxID=123214 RepID=C0QUA9_PERMH|nr:MULTISPECIES: hypothetical protein [Persephonella]ACO03674.1 conserved hypothetical protein [Persephonella marina EX-H1]HCB70107.1 hypothetical protein [Persephonella sp.]
MNLKVVVIEKQGKVTIVKCGYCRGGGSAGWGKCSVCGGVGVITLVCEEPETPIVKCGYCGGGGSAGWGKCSVCGGVGAVPAFGKYKIRRAVRTG